MKEERQERMVRVGEKNTGWKEEEEGEKEREKSLSTWRESLLKLYLITLLQA